ncbi:MAG: hypothetical protein HXX18_08090 [Bacteroidetes bacterium]|nr:hypothetical protein [Bacteroidota bacterium]
MNTFYSILSAVINPASGEKISLGLLLSDGNTSLFDYSDSRFSLLNSLIDKESKKFIRHYLKSIENVIAKIDVNQEQMTILDEVGKNMIINEPYISYMSVYNQNVVSFSKPVTIDVAVEEKIFTTLFSKFIDEETLVKSNTKTNIQILKNDFFSKVKTHYLIEKELTSKDFPDLLLPVSIDLFGKNENYVIAQFFELEKNINYIKNDYFDFFQLDKILKSGKKFFITQEPEKTKYQQQHYFWEQIRKQIGYTYIDISEIDIVSEYAVEHCVKPII